MGGAPRRAATGLAALLLAAAGCVAPPEPAGSRVVPHPIPESPPPVRRYLARPAAGAVTVDGRLDDPAWAGAAWSDPFVDIEGDRRPAPRWPTRVRMLWDSAFLYLGAELEEPHLWATLTTRDTVIYLDNDFEVFLDPDGDTHRYGELEINALGTVWDLELERPYRDGGPARNGWDITGLRAAVFLDGTLNDPRDRDRGWSVELAIPWAALSRAAPAEGEQWRVNFSRVQWQLDVVDGQYRKRTDPATGRAGPELNWVWSPQLAVNMHMPEMWGVVEFTAAPAGGAVRDPEDEETRWLLRRVYYAQRAHREQHGGYADRLDALGISPAAAAGLRPDSAGYLAWATAPGGRRWRIREDGRLWSEGP